LLILLAIKNTSKNMYRNAMITNLKFRIKIKLQKLQKLQKLKSWFLNMMMNLILILFMINF